MRTRSGPAATRVLHLRTATDDEIVVLAVEARGRFRRAASYGMLLYVPIAGAIASSDTELWLCAVFGALTLTLLVASIGLRRSPSVCARIILFCLVPLAPLLLLGTLYYVMFPRLWRLEDPRPLLRILDETQSRNL